MASIFIYLDIVYTNGANADYTPILKPYHGIRFFLNDGAANFNESFFYPLHGAYKAIPADFDLDGDLDILLGSMAFEVLPPMGLLDQWVQAGIPFVVLESRLK